MLTRVNDGERAWRDGTDMDSPLLFALAALALLATPGPTNTLLAASGAALGVRRSLPLIPAELAGYATAIGLLILLARPLVDAQAELDIAIRLGAGLWLAWSALHLWRDARTALAPRPAGAGRLFLTTLLNPKALVFAFAIFPAEGLGTAMALFALLCAGAGTGWVLLGRTLALGGYLTPRRVCRATAVAHAGFAAMVAGSALSL